MSLTAKMSLRLWLTPPIAERGWKSHSARPATQIPSVLTDEVERSTTDEVGLSKWTPVDAIKFVLSSRNVPRKDIALRPALAKRPRSPTAASAASARNKSVGLFLVQYDVGNLKSWKI